MSGSALNSGQIAALIKSSNAKSEELRRVERAKILLMVSTGETDNRIAEAVRLNKNSVRNTISKFHSMGLEAALSDLARSGRPTLINADAKAWVKSQVCVKPKKFGYAQELWAIQKTTSHIRDAWTQILVWLFWLSVFLGVFTNVEL
jgi:transposase